MENFHPRSPIEVVLSTLAFYGRERDQRNQDQQRNQNQERDRLPIPDPISTEYLIRAAVAIHRNQPIPQVPHGHNAALELSLGFLIRDIANALRLVAAVRRNEQQLYRNALDFALHMEVEIVDELDRNRPMFG